MERLGNLPEVTQVVSGDIRMNPGRLLLAACLCVQKILGAGKTELWDGLGKFMAEARGWGAGCLKGAYSAKMRRRVRLRWGRL